MGFQIIDAEGRTGWSQVTDQDLRNVDHKHRQVSGIVNRGLVDIHKIFQSPELFGIAEIELNLEAEAIIVNQFVIS